MSWMSRVRMFLARRDGVAQIAVVLGALGRLRGGAACDEAELVAGVREREPDRVGRGRCSAFRVGAVAAARVPRRSRTRRGAQRLLLRRALPPHGRSSSSGSTTGRATASGASANGSSHATAIALVIHWLFPTAPPRLAGVGLADTLLMFSGIDIGSPHSSAFSNPVAAVPRLHAGLCARRRRSALIRYATLASGCESPARSTRSSSC